ncbi:hypothetical protein Tco_1387831, partial [Tanacetum coccineum]
TMADMNMPAIDVPAEQAPAIAPPTRTDDQIFPSSKWVPIGKSSCVLDIQKSQRNPIFPIAVGILKNSNFFRAFRASSTILAIYIQQFWDTMCFNSSTGLYSSPPSSDTVIEYVNTLGYPCTLRNVSAMSVNALYQPWRAILSMINMCLTGKTAGYDRPRHPFVQSIQTFLTDRKNLATVSRGKKKTAHLLIPNVRYVGKDGREIFGMPIPDALLTDVIKSAPYYSSYLEHVTDYQCYLNEEHDKADDKSPEPALSQPPKPTPTPTESSKKDQGKKCKLVMESTDAPSPAKQSKAGKLSLKEQGERTQGPARPVVIKEPDSRRIQPLLKAGPNPGEQDEGQARSYPGDAAESQPQLSHVVHAGPNLEHMDLETTDASTQQKSETLSSLQNLNKDLSFTDQFFVEKPHEEEPGKTNAEADVQSMVLVLIHQDTSLVPPMTTLVIDLTKSQSDSPLQHQQQ